MRYINENLPPDARVLFIFMGNRGYHCDREYIFDMNNNRSMLHKCLKASDTTEDLLFRLQRFGITHVLMCYDIFNQWVKEGFTIEEQEFLGRFFKNHVKTLYIKAGYGVSRLEHSSL
jgi:hypothetical protein